MGRGRVYFWKQPEIPICPLFFPVVEFVQWVLHSFLKKHLLSQWDSGDFVLQLLCSLTATCYGFKIIPSRSVLRKTRGKRCSSGFTVKHSTLLTIWSISNIWKFTLFDPSEFVFVFLFSVFFKVICQEMELVCVPLNTAVEGSSERVHLELIKAVNYHFVYPSAQTWRALSKEKPVEEH